MGYGIHVGIDGFNRDFHWVFDFTWDLACIIVGVFRKMGLIKYDGTCPYKKLTRRNIILKNMEHLPKI
jgi:hypothetical protein